MGVCVRLAGAVVLFVLAIAPRAAHAAPLLEGAPGVVCDLGESSAEGCGFFAIDPVSATLSGQFEFDNDVALFQFTLTGLFTFTAGTTSFADGGFDPILKLYGAGGLQATQVTADGEFPVDNDDLDFGAGLWDAQLPVLVLGPGIYTLALTQTGNFPHESLAAGFDWSDPLFACATFSPPAEECVAGVEDMFGVQSGLFSLDLTLTPADTAPVPEPGTLSLVALGTAAAALWRRRRARHHTNTL